MQVTGKFHFVIVLQELLVISDTLKNIIFDAIIKLRESGTVHVLVTDIGSNFLQMSCELGISNKNSVVVNEQKYTVYF